MSSTDVIKLTAEFSYMKDQLSEIRDILYEHIKKEELQIEKLLDKLDNKYAPKYVQRVMDTILYVGGTTLIGLLVYLLEK